MIRVSRRRILGALAVGSVASIATACGENRLPQSSAPRPIGNGASRGTDTLTIYSGRSENLVEPIIQQFAAASGLRVGVKYAKTAELAATILEEGSSSPADIFFAQDPGGLGAVEHVLSALPNDILGMVPEWARSTEGKWVGISGRARVITFNTDRLTEADLPDDIWGFADPAWRNRIGWAPTNASFQTMVTGMRSVWGEERTREWLDGIIANDPGFYPKNTPIVAAVGSGEIDVGFVNHYYLFRFLAERGEAFPARNYHPRSGGPGALVMVAGAGIFKSSKNGESARKFLDFALSREAQAYFAGETYEYPLVVGVPPRHLLKPLDQIDQPEITVKDLLDLKGTQALLRDAGALI